MNDKTIAELRELIRECRVDHLWYTPEEKFDEILSRHEAEQGEGLREAVKAVCNHFHKEMYGFYQAQKNTDFELIARTAFNIVVAMEENIDEAFSRHPIPDKAVEPLAVLADRKGQMIMAVAGPSNVLTGKWQMRIGDMVIVASTYALAEAKARAYLMALEDKEGA